MLFEFNVKPEGILVMFFTRYWNWGSGREGQSTFCLGVCCLFLLLPYHAMWRELRYRCPHENDSTTQALALQSSRKKCTPPPNLVLWQLVFPPVSFSGGYVFVTDAGMMVQCCKSWDAVWHHHLAKTSGRVATYDLEVLRCGPGFAKWFGVTDSARNKHLDLRGFDSNMLFIVRGWISRPVGGQRFLLCGFPRNSESTILSLRIISLHIGRWY